MRIDDRIVGLVLIAFGAAVFWIARSFPLMAGLPYGPGFFPSIAAVGLMVCGAAIALAGFRPAPAASDGPVEPATAAEAMDGRMDGDAPHRLGRPLIIVAIVLGFGLGLDPLGFHLAGFFAVLAAALVFGARPPTAVVLAVLAAFGFHAVFYSMLRVPLPWGVLTPYAW